MLRDWVKYDGVAFPTHMQSAGPHSSQGKLAITALLLGIIALAVAGYSVYALTTQMAKKAPLVLKYDVKVLNFVESNSSRPVGDTFVVTGLVFPQGQVDKVAPIGNYTSTGTFINKAGDDVSLQVLAIKGMGQIFVSGLEPAPPDVVFSDAVVGGTGEFAGAQGTADHYYHGYDLFYTITITSTSTS